MAPKARIKRAAEVSTSAAEAINTVETPSQSVVSAASATGEAIDSQGRVIKVRKLSALQRLRMAEALGELVNNQAYAQIAATAMCVSHIDGDAVSFPTSKMQVEALVERLGDPGLEAAAHAISKMLGFEIDADGNVLKDGEVIVRAKN